CLNLYERLIGAIRYARHGTHGRTFGKAALLLDKGTLICACLSLIKRKAQVAAKNALTFRSNACADRTRDGVHTANGCNTQRDTGEENIKTGQTTAHFT